MGLAINTADRQLSRLIPAVSAVIAFTVTTTAPANGLAGLSVAADVAPRTAF